jgi:hypothetical protein
MVETRGRKRSHLTEQQILERHEYQKEMRRRHSAKYYQRKKEEHANARLTLKQIMNAVKQHYLENEYKILETKDTNIITIESLQLAN